MHLKIKCSIVGILLFIIGCDKTGFHCIYRNSFSSLRFWIKWRLRRCFLCRFRSWSFCGPCFLSRDLPKPSGSPSSRTPRWVHTTFYLFRFLSIIVFTFSVYADKNESWPLFVFFYLTNLNLDSLDGWPSYPTVSLFPQLTMSDIEWICIKRAMRIDAINCNSEKGNWLSCEISEKTTSEWQNILGLFLGRFKWVKYWLVFTIKNESWCLIAFPKILS